MPQKTTGHPVCTRSRACAGDHLCLLPACRGSSFLPAMVRSWFAFLLFLVGGVLGFNAHAAAPVITQGAGPLTKAVFDNVLTTWSPAELSATDANSGDTLTWGVDTNASHGTVTISGTGASPTTFTYLPTLGYSGNDSFVAKVSDGTSIDTITVNLTVSFGPPPVYTTTVNGINGTVPTQTIVAAVGSMPATSVLSDPVGTTPDFQLTPVAGSMNNLNVTAASVGLTPNFSFTPSGGSMPSINVNATIVAGTSDFSLTPVSGSMAAFPVTAPWSTTTYSEKGTGYHVSEDGVTLAKPVISIIAVPSFNTQTTTATVASDGTLSFVLPPANETGQHYISAAPGTYFKVPAVTDKGVNYEVGVAPAVTVTRGGNPLDVNGSALAAADGKVDISFVGNALSASPVTVAVASWYAFDTLSYSGKGSSYHVTEDGVTLIKPVITVTPPVGSSTGIVQEVNATVASNGTLSFTLPVATAEGNHVITAATGTYYRFPVAYNKGGGYTPGVTPAVTITRGGNPVGATGSAVAGADGRIDVTFTGNAGAGAATVAVDPGAPGWTETVSSVSVGTGGSNYVVDDVITMSEGGGTGAIAKVASVGSSGEIQTVAMIAAGSGYTTAPIASISGVHKATTAHASVIDFSTSDGAYPGGRAFDGSIAENATNRWSPLQSALPNVHLTWQFTNPFKATQFKIKVYDLLPGPKDFKLQGSQNGSSWTDLAVVTDESSTPWTANEMRTYTVDNPGLYTYYKFLVSAAASADASLDFREIELWGGSSGTGAVLSPNLTTVNANPYVNQGTGYHLTEDAVTLAKPVISIVPPVESGLPDQTVNATVAANGKLTYTLPAPTTTGVHTISASTGTYFQLPSASNKGSGYAQGGTPAVTVKRAGAVIGGIAGNGTAGSDGKIDLSFTGNAVNADPVDVSVAPGPLAFAVPSFTGLGSTRYHVSETPLITITKPSLATQTLNATVEANGSISFTLPTPVEQGTHAITAAPGSVMLLPPGMNEAGSGYLSTGSIPAITVTDPLAASLPGASATINPNGTLDIDLSAVTPTVAGDYLVNATSIGYPPATLTNVGSSFNHLGFPPIVTLTGADVGTVETNATLNSNGTLTVSFTGLASGYGNLALSVTQARGNLPTTSSGKIVANDALAGDGFGGRESVSQSGDLLAVGSVLADPNGKTDAGAVYLYQVELNGTSTFLSKVLASDGVAGDNFGKSVSLAGDILVIGAQYADPGGTTNAGAAYVYRVASNGNATFLAKMTASDGAVDDFFGMSVSQSGDLLAVGAHYADPNGQNDAGAVYLYRLEANDTVTFLSKVIASDGAADDKFGQSVSQSGDLLAVGSKKSDPNGVSDAGAVYLYRVAANGAATLLQKVIASDGAAGDLFGESVSQSGDLLAIGASGATSGAGAAYLYRVESNDTVTLLQKMTASDGAASDKFGHSVSQSGNLLAVGAIKSDGAVTNTGGTYLYQVEDNGSVFSLGKVIASDGAADDDFGVVVSLFGNRLAVGADKADPVGTADAGAVHVYHNPAWGNRSPAFASANASFSLFENAADTFSAVATDLDANTTLIYSKSGADAAMFNLDVGTGELSFISPPDFETPTDVDGNNRYEVEVTVSDGVALATQAIVARVYNVLEGNEKPPFVTVDLSGGSGATAYPVTHHTERPDDWSSSSYKTDKILLAWIAPGTFNMGEVGIVVPYQVVHGKGFYLGIYETTGSQYAKVTGSDPSGKGGGIKPVENVNWHDIRGGVWPDGGPDATSFLGKLRAKTNDAFFDLPTESQWEYAARAGVATTFSHGDDNASLGDSAWYLANAGGTTHEVGLKLPNPWGLYDLHGNVWEWCLDWRSGYPVGPVVDPVGSSSGTARINRGGSYNGPSDWARLSHRGDLDPTTRYTSKGMRLVLNLPGRLTNRTPSDLNVTVSSIPENQVIGSPVGDFNATDADENATHVFTLIPGSGSTHNALFNLSTSGSLTTALAFDYEVNATLSIRVRATDEHNATFDKSFAIQVIDLNEPPIITSNGGGATASLNVAENMTAVTTVAAADQDGDSVSYSLSGGDDQTKFTIDPLTGVLAFATAPDYEIPTDLGGDNTYLVTVRATAGLQHDEQAVTVNVTNVNEAPVITSNGGAAVSQAVPENQTAVATVVAVDQDGDNLTYTLSGGVDQAKFTIGSSSGALAFANAPDYEIPTDADANNTYHVNVRVSDGFLSVDQAFSLTVLDLNEAPVITTDGGGGTAALSVVENQTAVTTVAATDQDGNPLTYSLSGGADQAEFTIDATSGVLTFVNPPDHENSTGSGSNGSYLVIARASDGSLHDDQTITVTVTDVNEAPAIISNGGGATGTQDAPENQTAVTTVTADDPEGDPLTYSIEGGPHQAKFSIHPTSGVLTLLSAPDYENPSGAWANHTYVVIVRVTDGTFIDEQTLTVSIVNQNELPTDISLSNGAIAENQPAGSAVGNFTATDPDAGDTFVYTLVDGLSATHNYLFDVDASGTLVSTATFDHDANATVATVFGDTFTRLAFYVRVRATDAGGDSIEKVFVISVTNVNETPTDIFLSNAHLTENEPAGFIVGTLTASDPDLLAVHSFSLVDGNGSTDNHLFNLESNGTLSTAAALDHEDGSALSIRARVVDELGASLEKIFIVTVSDIVGMPTSIFISNTSIAENLPAGSVVGIFGATDSESGVTHSFTLVDGDGSTDNHLFDLNPNGTLMTAAPLDHESASSLSIRARVTDQYTASLDGIFTITVTDSAEAPSDIALSHLTIAENQPPGTIVGYFSATDPDPGDYQIFSLVGGPGDTHNHFFVLASNGSLVLLASLDHEVTATLNVRVRATDGHNAYSEETFVISVDDDYTEDGDGDGFTDLEELLSGTDPTGADSAPNSPPSNLILSFGMILENQSANTFAGQFSTEDPDQNDSHVYSLVEVAGSPNNPIFRIEGDTLYAMGYFDFETQEAHQIRVRSTDDEGLSKEQDFTVKVLDAFRPGVETLESTQLAATSARLRGRILDNGGLDVLEQGFVVGLQPDPEPGQDGVKVFLGNSADSSGEFHHQVADLSAGSTYNLRAFARNSEGVTYGEQVRLTLTDDGAPDIWADSTEIPGMPNWRESHWFGSFFQSGENWIYHSGLGWLYLTKKGTDGFWLWSESLGWIWTGKGVFPYFYRNAESNWYLYLQNTSGRTILFRYATREWVDL